jgi:two-component sensor histidine kinase
MIKTFLYPIRSRLTLALMIPLLPIVIAMIAISLNANRTQEDRASESTKNYALIASGYQKETLDDLKQLLNVLVEGQDYKTGQASCTRSLNKVLARLEMYSSIAVIDKNGLVICGTGTLDGTNISDRAYFQQSKKTMQFTISESLIGRSSKTQILIGAMPWANDNGDFAGMVTASIDAAHFAASFQEMPLPPGSRYYLLDQHDQLIAGSDPLPESLRAKLANLPVVNSNPVPFLMHDDSVSRTYTAMTLENGALTVLIGIPRRFFLNVDSGNFIASLVGPIALLLVVLTTIWFLSNRLISAPVTSLIRTARAYSRGDLTVRPVADSAGGELKELSSTFAEMADRIAMRESELQDAITRRELMLREIHHRVKNNLQIVISLINLQSKSVAIPAAQEAFTEIQTRMRALALVHRYLYESDDLQSVNIGSFVTELCSSLQLAYGISPARVLLHVEADAIWDVSDRAIPLALFMTETISNALRHAFPAGQPGHIQVLLKALGDGRASFTVEDDGIGIGSEALPIEDGIFRSEQPFTGLGLSLTKAFARQIDGELTISPPPGTKVSLIFKVRQTGTAPPTGI